MSENVGNAENAEITAHAESAEGAEGKHKRRPPTRRRFIGIATGVVGGGALGGGAIAFGDEFMDARTYAAPWELRARRRAMARIVWSADPAEISAWIVGRGEAPAEIKTELDQQVEGLARAAATGTGASDADSIVVSRLRDAATQRTIWDRKYDFLRTSEGGAGTFGIITEESRRTYGDKLGSGTQWDPDNEAHREVWSSLTSEKRQMEILQTSTAPGVSRHHTGADIDLFSTTPADWSDSGPMAGQYAWLLQNAAHYGFTQPYTAESTQEKPAISEERWHWSYYPVSQVLLDFVRADPGRIQGQLEELWSYDPARYTYIHENWPNYMFHVSESVDFSYS